MYTASCLICRLTVNDFNVIWMCWFSSWEFTYIFMWYIIYLLYFIGNDSCIFVLYIWRFVNAWQRIKVVKNFLLVCCVCELHWFKQPVLCQISLLHNHEMWTWLIHTLLSEFISPSCLTKCYIIFKSLFCQKNCPLLVSHK